MSHKKMNTTTLARRLLAHFGIVNRRSIICMERGSAAINTTSDILPSPSGIASKAKPGPAIARIAISRSVSFAQSSG